MATTASHDEAMPFVESNKIMGRGIGYVDAHLLAACRLNGNTQLWTEDKHLAQLTEDMGMAFQFHG